MKIVRIIFISLLTGVFLFLAYYLYNRQQNKYTFRSFELKENATSLAVPNIDRLLVKVNTAAEVEGISENSALESGLNLLLEKRTTRVNPILGKACFLSFNATDFVLAFSNPDLNFDDVITLLNDVFGISATYVEEQLKFDGQVYQAQQFGTFTVISSQIIKPNFNHLSYPLTNADYFVLTDSLSTERFILANNSQFKVWNETREVVRGSPVNHTAFIEKLPLNFNSAVFYGSERLIEDKNTFFPGSDEEAFSWLGNGLLIMKKDSFQLMLANQNDQRDLRLILEEQTLNALGDSAQLTFFNVKNVEIMPFKSSFAWKEVIPELDTDLNYFAEYENFNVVSNSLAAMRWYLSEIQTGNLYEENMGLMEQYDLSTPLKSHIVKLSNATDGYRYETATWTRKTMCTHTLTSSVNSNDDLVDTEDLSEFGVPFKPLTILPLTNKADSKILLVNKTDLAVLNSNGEVAWKIKLPGTYKFSPEIIDLENDGTPEIAICLARKLLVYDIGGQPKVTIDGSTFLSAGSTFTSNLIVNYDRVFDFRFFLADAQNIYCFNESAERVDGFQFQQSASPLSGQSYYTQIAGKDYLMFNDVNGGVYLLNRRGESRFAREISTKNLPKKSRFLVGKDESTLALLGYRNQYIYSYYLKDGVLDSTKLDKQVTALNAKWILPETPTLVIDEPGRIVLFNRFGYVEKEILKPETAGTFVAVEAMPTNHYVFFDNTNNSLYLLNKDGKLVLTNPSEMANVYGINNTLFYTYDRQKIKQHKLKKSL